MSVQSCRSDSLPQRSTSRSDWLCQSSGTNSPVLDAIVANKSIPYEVADSLGNNGNCRSFWHTVAHDSNPTPRRTDADANEGHVEDKHKRWKPGYPVPNRTRSSLTPRRSSTSIVELDMPVDDYKYRQPLPVWVGLTKVVNELKKSAVDSFRDSDQPPDPQRAEAENDAETAVGATPAPAFAKYNSVNSDANSQNQPKKERETSGDDMQKTYSRKESDDTTTIESPSRKKEVSARQMVVFRSLQVDGELPVENLLQAVKLLGFPQINQEWVNDVLKSKECRYGTLSEDEFVDFILEYDAKQQQFILEKFREFDVDGAGSLDASELGELLKAVGAFPLPHVLKNLISEVDDNGTGQLELEEFRRVLTLLESREGFSKPEIDEFQKAFHKFDRDRSGEVNGDELLGILGWLGYPQRQETVTAVMKQADQDGSGCLSWPELLICMRWYREKEIQYVQGLMAEHDSDGSGTIERSELETLLGTIGYAFPRDVVIFECMEVIGLSSYEPLNFPNLWQVLQVFRLRRGFLASEENLMAEAFSQFDRSGSGFINTVEVGKAMRLLGYQVPIEQQHRHVKFVDVDGSGHLDMSEFRTLMRRHREHELRELAIVFDTYAVTEENFGIKEKKLETKTPLRRALRRVGLGTAPDLVNIHLNQHHATSTHINFQDFVVIIGIVRNEVRLRMRESAGFTENEVNAYKEKFKVYDEDETGDIAGPELRHLLNDIFPEASRNFDTRSRIARLLSEVDRDGNGILDFTDFLRLMRHYQDDCEMQALSQVNENFSEEEVAQFSEIFNAEVREQFGGQEPRITTSIFQTMIIKICPLSIESVETLAKIVRECQDEPGASHIVFFEFLRIMRRVVDQNLGNILAITAQRIADPKSPSSAKGAFGKAFSDKPSPGAKGKQMLRGTLPASAFSQND